MKSRWAAGMMVVGLLMAGVSHVGADARNYVWTYEYMTMPEGAAEVEYYLTVKVPDTGVSEVSSWQHQVELEYGITPRWDVSMYQVWQEEQTGDGSEFGYEGFKVRTRYRLLEKGELPVDVLFYGEYERAADLLEDDVGEAKLVLSKEVGKFDMSYNQVVERALTGAGETEHKYAAGLGYEVRSGVHAGLESTGNYTESEFAMGPTVALARQRYFFSLGALAGLNDKAPDLQVRLIIGVGL